MFKEIGIKKNDMVRLKFKPVLDVIKSLNMTFKQADEVYCISENFTAYSMGGDFLVDKVKFKEYEEENEDGCIVILNHFDAKYNDKMYVYKEFIESIEIINDSDNRFISTDLNLCVIRLDNDLVINGNMLIGNQEVKKEDHERAMRRSSKTDPYVDPSLKLLKIFEDFITDMAVNKGLKGEQ
jgi:hypothetical protein